MKHLRSYALRLTTLLFVCGLVVSGAQTQRSTAAQGTLTGVVVDATGARIPGALLHVRGRSAKQDVISDEVGHFSLTLSAGSYALSISANGFVPLQPPAVQIKAGNRVTLSLTLEVNTATTEVNVNSSEGDPTGEAGNKSALTLSGNQLSTFSDDDATFQQQIQAIAGGGDPSETQLLVDGFSGGRFPPKSTVREIRINSNPFSAEYDSLGFGRIEVFTKPGANKLHGSLDVGGNDQSFNARNPYTGPQPPYHNLYVDEHIDGPLGRRTSFFAAGTRSDQQNNAVVNAVTDSGPVSEAIPNPQITDTASVRLDRQVTPTNVLTGRYEWNNRGQANSGVGLLVLPSEGVTTGTTTQTLQLSDTATIGAATLLETRFEYIRTRLRQTPNSTAPAGVVEGSFSGGGSPTQAINDSQDHYEWQEYLSHSWGMHLLRTGGRLRANREANTSTGGFNGGFTFPSLAAYQTTLAGTGQGASQFDVTTGSPSAEVSTVDFAAYAEDEWKLRKEFTLDVGFRFESQTAIPDRTDPAPRIGAAYSVPSKGGEPLLVLRSGFGLFYDRFAIADLLTAVRQNGISQLAYYAENPGFFCGDGSCIPTELHALPSVEPTIYRVNPQLRSPYRMVASLSAEHSFGEKGTVGLTYVGTHNVHQFLSRNLNAPLPGTYDPGVLNSGTRPLGGTQNLYEFSSDGVRHGDTLSVNVDLNPTKRLSVWAFANKQNRTGDSFGADTFPSNEYNLAQDFGRTTANKKRIFTGVWYNGPKSVNGGLFLRSYSGTPFNITTGTDLNGDTQFNDRPAYATDLSRPSVVHTRYGIFDTEPMAGQRIIPINLATSPAYVSLNVVLAKEFQFGPTVEPEPAPPGEPSAKPAPRFNLRFSIEAQNVTNHTNPGVPVGVLSSPYFGRSISLADTFSGITAANRTLTLHSSLSF